MANIPLKTIKFPGLDDTYTVPQIDSSFTGVAGEVPDSNKVKGEISSLREDLSEIFDATVINALQSTNYFTFAFVAGNEYQIQNDTPSSLNAYTLTDPSSSGTVIDIIGENVLSGQSKTFTATANAPGGRLYCVAAGKVTITNISKGFPVVEESIEELIQKSDDYVEKNGTAQVTEKNTTFFSKSDNILDISTVEDGVQINQAGTDVYTRDGFTTTGYISVLGQTNVYPCYEKPDGVVADLGSYYVFYSANKTPLAQRATASGVLSIPANAAFLRFSFSTNAKTTAMLVEGNTLPAKYIGYGYVFDYTPEPEPPIEVYPTSDIIDILLANGGKTIHFNDGEYDIIAIYENKFGSDYFTNYIDYTSGGNNVGRGLPVLRGTTLRFSQGAKFTANYNGGNSAVATNFAAFALEGGVEIDGLTIDTSGIRNPIHDDFDNYFSGTTVIKNCRITSDKVLIAGGLGVHDLVILESNYFVTSRVGNYDVSYHNSSIANAQSRVVIKDNYFAKGMRFAYYGTTTLKTDALVSGNSFAYDVTYEAETAQSTSDNINILKWGNTIRS